MIKFFKYAIGILFCFACEKSLVKQPDKILSEEEMQDIIYDLSILRSINLHQADIFNNNNIIPIDYLYNKYCIDSTLFADNLAFYATKPKKLETILSAVKNRIELKKKLSDSLQNKHPFIPIQK